MRALGRREMMLVSLGAALAPRLVRAQDAGAAVPEHNRATLTEPPPRPPLGLAEGRSARLFDAIVNDDPARADDFFLSREAFRLIKAVPNPDPLWERLHGAYVRDIHALHAQLARTAGPATYTRLRFTGRRGWVVVGEEANRLPYWAQRHSLLEYTAGGHAASIEVRTMITWDDQWFITHLSEFHH